MRLPNPIREMKEKNRRRRFLNTKFKLLDEQERLQYYDRLRKKFRTKLYNPVRPAY